MTNRDRLMKALWLCEDIPYSVYKSVWEQISRTGDKKSPGVVSSANTIVSKYVPGVDGWKYARLTVNE